MRNFNFSTQKGEIIITTICQKCNASIQTPLKELLKTAKIICKNCDYSEELSQDLLRQFDLSQGLADKSGEKRVATFESLTFDTSLKSTPKVKRTTRK